MRNLVQVGWGRLRNHFPERGPLGDTWIDPVEVVAVMAASNDRFYHEQSLVMLRSGKTITVLGKPEEVLQCLGTKVGI